jgi:hypothetical protein
MIPFSVDHISYLDKPCHRVTDFVTVEWPAARHMRLQQVNHHMYVTELAQEQT